ncbi:hypothetical protein [Brevibacterium luteolum]|uniref:Uncharacterized protein n=1 Tax=Brevibacterium luteolum TaxID=199591 RepID=A0A849AKN1_9MICO|nr:hypothetical protein [Brevibacterium luteolum]MBM7530411.1 hypothetical protein [Brevibacterium luteolum]NNG77808.1 hypothetical protein [Brevibacterium luteolum]
MTTPQRSFPTNLGQERLLLAGVHEGIEWALYAAPLWNAANGYVRLPDSHPWLAEPLLSGYNVIDISGGITYGPDSEGWIGFDTLHACDYWPDSPFEPRPYDRQWTRAAVREETIRLASQAAVALRAGDRS